MTLEEKRAKYKALGHAMQTGVAYEMENDPTDTTPKHLRVGVNAAMSDHAALASLLLEKLIFTEDEYYDRLIEFMQREVDGYQAKLSQRYGGADIKLG
jgi:hypothetical protein